MKICFAGDLFLGGDLLEKDTTEAIRIEAFDNADMRVVNLEQAVSDRKEVEEKSTLYSGSAAVGQLHQMKVDAVNMAHNHIQDKLIEGIIETRQHLENGSVDCFGAGGDSEQARKPLPVDDNTVILGYCDFEKPYLKNIEVAGDDKPGVNPLRYDAILDDLDRLQDNQRAILYFHWGREHVCLPPHDDIVLARKLLEDDRVLLIVGMHPHRAQGYIEHNGKRAYMSLGNFLFANFYIKPPTQIHYPEEKPHHCMVTRQYHGVSEITYKKWRWINRVSLVLTYDTQTRQVSHSLVIQDDNQPVVRDYKGCFAWSFRGFVWFLSMLYRLPRPIYRALETINTVLFKWIWNLRIKLFKVRQVGLRAVFGKILGKSRR